MFNDCRLDGRDVRSRGPQIAWFSAVAYGLSWAWWAPLVWPYLPAIHRAGPLPDGLARGGTGRAALGMFGPALAAILVRAIYHEKDWSLGFRRPWRTYAIAIGVPVLFVLILIGVDVASGLGRPTFGRSVLWRFPLVLGVGGLASLPLALGEEYGWRGYLLQRLLPSGRVKAAVIVGVLWGAWHTPVLLIGLNYPGQPVWAVLPLFLTTVMLTSFLFTWLYVLSNQSVMVVAVTHSVLNALTDTFTSPRYLSDANPLIAGGGGLVALGVLLLLTFIVRPPAPRCLRATTQASPG